MIIDNLTNHSIIGIRQQAGLQHFWFSLFIGSPTYCYKGMNVLRFKLSFHFVILLLQADQKVMRQLLINYLPDLDLVLKEHDIGNYILSVKKCPGLKSLPYLLRNIYIQRKTEMINTILISL